MQIRILASLLFLLPLASCLPDPKTARPMEARLPLDASNTPQQATNLVFQSADGGESWQDISAGLPVSLGLSSVFADRGEIFLGSEKGMYRRSTVAENPVWNKEVFLYESISNIFPGRVGPYACSFGNGFFQNILGTWFWNPMDQALDYKNVWAVLETQDGAVFAGCESGIFKSSDEGKSWKQVFDEDNIYSLIASNGMFFAGGSKGVLRSSDNGEHWEKVLNGKSADIKTGLNGSDIVAITFENWGSHLHISSDNGQSWQDTEESTSNPHFIYDIKQAGDYLFCSRDAGIFRSADMGKTWTLVLPTTDKMLYKLATYGKLLFVIKNIGC